MADSGLLIGQLADQLGMAPSALRYYEAAGLLAAERRTKSGYRVYGRRAADRLRFIRRATSLGLRLSEIKRLIDSPRGSREDESEFFERFLASKIRETQSQIASLRAVARQLRSLESNLSADPPPECCHLGDCACWLPT